MAHKLPRLSKSILERPQLMEASKFQEIAEVLENREYLKSFTTSNMSLDEDEESLEVSEDSLLDESVGVLSVEGPLTYKPSGWEAFCGGASYTGLLKQMNEFVDQGKKTVLMKIDSGGGVAYRMRYTSRELRRLADDNGIKLIAYVDGMMGSAATGLGVAAHEVIANPESSVGSIGVVISLLDDSKAMEDAGYKRVFITAGSEKVPFSADGTFREGFLADLQESVTDLYESFTTHVAEMRGIDVKVVRDTEARMFKASKALELGLVDKVMEEGEFYKYLAEASAVTKVGYKPTTPISLKTKEVNLMSKDNIKPEASVDANAELLAKVEAMQAAMATQTSQLEAFQAKELSAKQATLSAKLDSNAFLAASKEPLMNFFMSADINEDVKTLMDSVITAANVEMSAQAGVVEVAKLAAQAESAAELKVEQEKNVQLLAEKEALKVEFSAPNAIRGEEKEENLLALDHKEKLARAVAAVKAKKASL